MLQAIKGCLILFLMMAPATGLQADIEVIDDAGHRVQLAQPAQRIVSLAPHITELLFAAGAGSAVVGVSEYSDYPEAAQSVRRIGGGNGLDLEAIVALRPDLIVAWVSGNPAAQIGRLQALGLTVFLSEPRQLEDIPDTVLRLGKLAASDAQAIASAAAFRQRHRQLAQRYADRPPVSVFYQIWDHPLMTLNGEHLYSDVLQLCGGQNVFADLPTLAPQVGVEAVLAVDPDVIVIAAEAGSPMLARWQKWPSLRAVANQQVVAVDRGKLARHSPRILDGAAQLCEILEAVRERAEKP